MYLTTHPTLADCSDLPYCFYVVFQYNFMADIHYEVLTILISTLHMHLNSRLLFCQQVTKLEFITKGHLTFFGNAGHVYSKPCPRVNIHYIL